MEKTALKTRHYTIETRIPINGEIHFNCKWCQDTGVLEEWIAPDDVREVTCHFCDINEPTDMDDDS